MDGKKMRKFYRLFLYPFLVGFFQAASIIMISVTVFAACYLFLNVFTWFGMPHLWAIIASVGVTAFMFILVPFIIEAIIDEASGSDKKSKCCCGNCKCGVKSGE